MGFKDFSVLVDKHDRPITYRELWLMLNSETQKLLLTENDFKKVKEILMEKVLNRMYFYKDFKGEIDRAMNKILLMFFSEKDQVVMTKLEAERDLIKVLLGWK